MDDFFEIDWIKAETIINGLSSFDQSIRSTETKYIKLNTKTPNIFCHLNEFDDFFIHFDRGDKKTEGEKKFSFLKCKQKSNGIKKVWVLVFSFMYLVSVDPMDRSIIKYLKYFTLISSFILILLHSHLTSF